ncbi:hypothetical protein M3226_26790 [Neobacillus cucumis]|nr:hypothetical protein [Neobacillus cucumis]MCM3729217.1 hypothetical protein [Neobacillus cucumis]
MECIFSVKAPEDTLDSFTPTEIKKLITVRDEEMYSTFHDKVITGKKAIE